MRFNPSMLGIAVIPAIYREKLSVASGGDGADEPQESSTDIGGQRMIHVQKGLYFGFAAGTFRPARIRYLRTLKEIADRYFKRAGDLIKATGAYPIDSEFIFVHLLEADTDYVAQLSAAQAQFAAPQPNSSADMGIHWIAGFVL